MEAKRSTAAEQQREERERAQRRSRLSLRLGGIGVVVLFACGLGAWLVTEYIVAFLVGMALGIVFLLAAFFLVPGSLLHLRTGDRTKIL